MEKTESVKGQRQPGFELLRIICILMIVGFHYIFYGKAGLSDYFFPNYYTSKVIYHLGELGVDCFLLISGYFMPETTFKPKKVVLMLLQIEFYVVLCKAIAILNGEETIWHLFSFFPALQGEYWFIHVYLLLYLLQPFLKKMLMALSKRELESLICRMLLIWSVVPSLVLVTLFQSPSTEVMPFYNRYIWAIIVYGIGYYLREYGLPELKHDPLHIKESKPWMVMLLPYELMFLFIGLGELGFWPYNPTFFRTPNSLLMLFMSVALFYPFISWKPRYLRGGSLIYALSPCTLGIYLFHDGELRSLLWDRWFCYKNTNNWLYYLWQVLFTTVCVFLMGALIESVRRVFEKKMVIPALDKAMNLAEQIPFFR